MSKIKTFILNIILLFCDLGEKVEKGTASGEEAMAFGCLYLVVCGAILFILVAVIGTGTLICKLL